MAKKIRPDACYFPDWLHYELLNWSRWCWQGAWPHPLPPSHCESVEHEYTRHREEATADEARPFPPDGSRARIVDRVWHGLPQRPKLVLRAEYPQHLASGRAEFGRVGAARRLRLRLREYEAALSEAGSRVQEAFERGQ